MSCCVACGCGCGCCLCLWRPLDYLTLPVSPKLVVSDLIWPNLSWLGLILPHWARWCVSRSWLMDNHNFYWVQVQLMSSLTVWLFLLVIICIALLPDLLIRISHDIRNHRSVYRPVRLQSVLEEEGFIAFGFCTFFWSWQEWIFFPFANQQNKLLGGLLLNWRTAFVTRLLASADTFWRCLLVTFDSVFMCVCVQADK